MRSDARLVSGVVKRDANALATLYDRYAAIAYSILLRIVPDQATAGQVFEDLFRKIPELISEYNVTCHCLDAWMVLTARNFGIDHIRSFQLVAESVPNGVVDERRIVEMAFFDGFSLKELADRLSTPSHLMEGRLKAALQSIKRELKVPVH